MSKLIVTDNNPSKPVIAGIRVEGEDYRIVGPENIDKVKDIELRDGARITFGPSVIKPVEKVRAVAAYTTNSNDASTDAQAVVAHTVELSNGTKRQVMAEAPDDALRKVQWALDNEQGDI